MSESFSISTGVRQGCIISPLLFNTVVDAIMRSVMKNRIGVEFGRGQFVTDLMYADDIAIFANDEDEAMSFLHDISMISKAYGLTINAEKTKVLTTDGTSVSVLLNGVELEQVQHFKYLGSIVQQKKVASSMEILNRIGAASTAFGSLIWCLWRKLNITVSTKMRIYRALILPILLYGVESWTILQSDAQKLETFQMRCLRQILGIRLRNRIRSEEIRRRCNEQPTIASVIRKRRLKWFGHVCRMELSRLSRSCCGGYALLNGRSKEEPQENVAETSRETSFVFQNKFAASEDLGVGK
ncbi:hypothetical protein Y032_0407g912 [Ancylostoma ceylanicum]|uniref:Reverse transcriptase domain-containing protein n=1 Tax=Ancylostoma ceylanicum TaxID=53326 RepID=A0A016X2R8_9BILA|nr:hypothetical protein Y032_0407g912 [Ancylostoma ceylanicum]